MVTVGGIASDLISCCLDMQGSLLSPASLVEELFGEFKLSELSNREGYLVDHAISHMLVSKHMTNCKYECLNRETVHGSLNQFEEFDGVCSIWITMVLLEL